ncbi:acyl-CoA dehydrogenase family protein [Nocardioides zeae]|uniref:Acyl-CoA/acyl-ACP dehydrogenase n=2 Tax=Nocardioides zeae TaxID=1457234 RepID=A0A6P0HPB4_9ACTN|nr:acyl-CoA dehydrogenase family protein [Nocardioides zeae]NEN80436.1 acyl-CoA/acyl-ACP dehydrogenase [Nocardioides zeae]
MNFEESYEHASLRKTVAQVCAGFGDDYLRRVIAEDGRTHELWSALGEAGLLGVNLPEEYGGGGAGIAELAIVVEEAAASGNPLLLLLVSAAISGEVLKDVGTDEQKARWLPAMADGSDKMVFAITEPDAGSNSHQISTKAVRDGDDWVLSGTKYYISGVDEASNLLVVARTGTSPSGRGEMTLFVVPTDDERLHRALIPVEVRAPEKQYTLTFDGVRVGDDRRVGEVGRGMDVVFRGLNPERITGAAIETGIARYALGKAAAYARERTVWGGTPIGAHQGVAHPLAAAAIDVELARLMTSRAAWLHDNGLPAGESSNMAKYAAADAALKALDAAIQAHGGNGLATEYGLAHLWGTARLLKVAPVSREMVLNFVATHTLGLPRSY